MPTLTLSTSDMERRLAYALSIAFQPLFVPLYTVLLMLGTGSYLSFAVQGTLRWVLLFIITINTILLPMLVFAWFVKRKIISSYHMAERNERHLPFLVGITFLISTYILLGKLPLPGMFRALVLTSVASLVVTALINMWWKISVHMMGMGGMLGSVVAMAMMYQVPVMPMAIALAFAAGLVGWSRLCLDAHTPAQVYSGFTLGLVLTIVCLGVLIG